MSKPEVTLDIPEINPELGPFYQALGRLNTNLVARVVLDPNAIPTVTEFIGKMNVTLEVDQCDPGWYWDGLKCVKKPDPLDLV